ncbi:uncharacterized protein K02A2.6-like [Haliotis rufescens]|uniref:uncharacterized protein K02A2.6-like n=1 Tax=Haliotis rufescens TaxID=6454 RepID=UPI00201EF9F3|nr:uncharacterized protein K02A2.6-like [Haliotis rufescens]
MASSTSGKIDEFNTETDSWDIYCERLDLYFTARGVDDEDVVMKRAILLSEMGKTAYTLLRNLCAPTKPREMRFAEIVKVMRDHQHPTPSVIVERLKFHKRDRKSQESVAAYASELRKLASTCDFGTTLDDSLRDRLVCGINNDAIQRRLLAEKALDYNKAFTLAQSMELAAKNEEDIKVGASSVSAATGGNMHKMSSSQHAPVYPPCDRCGLRNHKSPDCHFRTSKCYNCGKIGHIGKVCRQSQNSKGSRCGRGSYRSRGQGRSRGQHKRSATNQVTPDNYDDVESEIYDIYKMETSSTPFVGRREKEPPMFIDLALNGLPLSMELDTGATFSVINEDTYRSLGKDPPKLGPPHTLLRTYLGEKIPLLGSCSVKVNYGKQSAELPVIVVKGRRVNLFGRDWLRHVRLDWGTILRVDCDDVQSILNSHSDVFKEELGELKDTKVKINISIPSQPRFYKHRNMAYALRDKVENELERLEQQGVIKPVQYSEWAAPTVPVLKSDQSSVRICGDYKLTVNQVAKPDCYPIPRIEDLFASLSGGRKFTKLDMSNAYQQIVLDDDSKKLTTINTHKGLYEYQRLPFGVSAAPAIFQRTIECLLSDLPHVCVYLDDILVTGVDDAEHNKNLNEVLDRLQKAGLRLNASKCHVKKDSVTYLGHRIDAQGLHPLEEKVNAIVSAPAPQNVTKLKSFLGMVQYYQRFLPNLSTTLVPLHGLLQKDAPWSWTKKHDTVFLKVKSHLSSCKVLTHYNPDLPLNLAADASPYGVGAVLSHIMPDGTEKPVAFASCSLSPAEKNYSQLDKEALAIVFGIKKFHQYLFGRKFQLLSDHKPLMGLLDAEKGIPVMASARLRRWALMLAAYDYSIVYKPGSKLANADCLSRLPLQTSVSVPPVPGDTIMLLENMAEFPVNVRQIQFWTRKDPLLARVKKLVECGFPENLKPDTELKPYIQKKTELSVQDGVILWGNRVVVPPQGRKQCVDVLHEAHPGIARMKAIARGLVWWPCIDSELENKVRTCSICQESRSSPCEAKLHPWDWPSKPWSRLHIDYAGPLQGQMFLIIVDSHSKWMDVFPVNSATTSATLECLRRTFSIHGLPETIVSDNGTCFTSDEFAIFIKRNGIQHICTSPYHPASNGLAERSVQTFKQGFKKLSGGSINTRVSRFLFRYRNTPQTTTGSSPAQLLFGRRPRSHLDLLHPDIGVKVQHKQEKQAHYHNRHTKSREFAVGDLVYVRNFLGKPKWLPGEIIQCTGPISFKVSLENNKIARRHVDHLIKRYVDPDAVKPESPELLEESEVSKSVITFSPELPEPSSVPVSPADTPFPRTRLPTCDTSPELSSSVELRRSTRERRAPDRLNL